MYVYISAGEGLCTLRSDAPAEGRCKRNECKKVREKQWKKDSKKNIRYKCKKVRGRERQSKIRKHEKKNKKNIR